MMEAMHTSRLFHGAWIAAALAVAAPLHANEDLLKLSPQQAKSLAIATQPLSGFASGGERRLPAQAVVPPRQVEVLAAPLGGLVVAVEAAYGETVRKGQPLARLKSPEALALQREYLQARSQAKLAAENLKRDKALYEEGIIAGGRLATTESSEHQAAAQAREKRQAMQIAGLGEGSADALAGTLTLSAPFDGVILEATAQAGQRVDANTPLFRLGRLQGLWLEIQATPAQAAGLAVGDSVAVPGCAAKGRLTLVAPAMNAANQSLLLRAEMPKSADCLKPFQYTQAEVVPARPGSGWRVPNSALTRHQGQSWLFAEVPGGYRPVAVRLLDETEKTSLVAADLPPETKIVVKGVAALKATWLGLGSAAQ
ncbi:MAG: hypothetical protein H6R10_3700 [Rhodocyclaceae bacterium]|nr:hypothetical protein [Rhodocyclaceae bacterium]